MSLVTLPPEVAQLLARWQAVHAPTDITDVLVDNTRTLLNALTTLPDQRATMNTQVTDLTNQVQNLRDEQQVALDAADAQHQEITRLQTELTAAQANLTDARLIATALSRAAPAGSREKIPKPKEFDGSRNKLQAFLTQLRLHTATFADEQAKLRLAINCLTGEALDHARMYVQNDRVNLANLNALITVLENAFGNPNRVAEAESKLSTIQQGNRDFSTYYAEFQRYAAEVAWDEVSRLAALKRGLAYRLKNDLITVRPQPTALAEFTALCNDLDTSRRQLQGESHRPTAQQHRPTPRTQAAVAAPAPPPSTSTGTAPGPMDLSANRRRLSPEERAKRMAEGRCYRCGGVGHMARECPLNNRPMHAAEVQLAPLTPDTPGPSSPQDFQ